MEFPAIRFLSRGQQLARIQGRVVQHMMTDLDAEQAEFSARPPVSVDTDMPAFVSDIQARVARGQERVSDIQLMFQMFFCRHVDNFQIFIEELARDISTVQPAVIDHVKIKNPEKLPLDQRRAKRLRRLSFLSIRELSDLFESAIQFELFSSAQVSGAIEQLYDLRNLITHNYGFGDLLFVSRNPTFGPREGEQFEFATEFIGESFQTLIQLSGDIQTRAQTRFKLWHTAA